MEDVYLEKAMETLIRIESLKAGHDVINLEFIIYLIDVLVSLLFILIPCMIPYEHSCLHFLHCT